MANYKVTNQKDIETAKLGEIFHEDTMFLRNAVGIATDPDDTTKEYELTTSMGSGFPMVTSKVTGQTYLLPWKDIVTMAVESGIDEELKFELKKEEK